MSNPANTAPQTNPLRILLLDLLPVEQIVLERDFVLQGRPWRFLHPPSPEEATVALVSGAADVLVGGCEGFLALENGWSANLGALSPLPTLILAGPGAEERAAPLLLRGHIEVVLREGNYLRWLPLWLHRLCQHQQAVWEELGRIIRHEINNPLTGVLGNAELSLADPAALPPPVRERLRTIVRLAVRMRDVLRTLEERRRPDTTATAQRTHPLPMGQPPVNSEVAR